MSSPADEHGLLADADTVSESASVDAIERLVEAALFAAGEPLPVDRLLRLCDESVSAAMVEKALDRLQQHYVDRGVVLVQVAGGWRFQVADRQAAQVARLWDERPGRYSRALLETLAIIAYRQPVTRGEIEEIRGVALSTSIMRTLHERGWIRSVGHREAPGRPALFATTRQFLDDFTLQSLSELPPLPDLDQDADP